MHNKLITVMMLVVFSGPAVAQESTTAVTDNQSGKNTALAAVTSMSDRISRSTLDRFLAMEELTTDKDLIAAITTADTAKLMSLATDYQERLEGSLKVRLYRRDTEETDNESRPACGFACIELVRDAYQGEVLAEALLFRSADANITFAKGIANSDGQVIGAMVAHYSYDELKQEITQSAPTAFFTELRQRIDGGQPILLLSHGDHTARQGPTQKVINIPGSRWLLAIWTPGGIAIEQYEPPELPWLYILLCVVILIVGLLILIIYRIKHPHHTEPKVIESLKSKQTVFNAEAISYDDEHESPTLIMGGGAEEVDVAKYLKDANVTNFNKQPK